jgi:hypothetical protein
MQGEKWTFLVFRGEDSVRQYSLSSRAVRLVLGSAGSAAVVGALLLVVIGLSGWSRAELALAERENALLQEQLSDMQAVVTSLEGAVGELAEKDAKYRVLAGLDSFDDDVLQAGVGGPGLATPSEDPLWQLDPDLGEETFALRYDLSALERRAHLLSESISEATDSLEAHHDLLERTPSILPTAGFLSSRFSSSRYHPIHHRNLPHEGIDIGANQGTAILAAAKGRVTHAGRRSGLGLMVEIDHGNGHVTRYGHASKVLVRRGQEVSRGDVIGQVGRTGIATSPHLHYEVRINGRPVNPMNYVISGAIP